MKNLLFILACFCLTSNAGAQTKFLAAGSDGVQGEYLVVLEDATAGKTAGLAAAPKRSVNLAAQSLIKDYDGHLIKIWHRVLPALLVRMPENTARLMAMDPRVRLVEQNRRLPLPEAVSKESPSKPMELSFESTEKGAGCTGAYCQTLICPDPTVMDICDESEPPNCSDNWGLDRVDATPGNGTYEYNATGFGVHIFFIDAGLSRDHSEFSGRVRTGFDRGAECDPATCNLGDLEGNDHGNRVSSIAGGLRFGVSKDSFLHPVVLRGDTAEFLDALEWIVEHRDQHNLPAAVINASFNFAKLENDPEHLPQSDPYCISLAALNIVEGHGIPIVVSAGNRATTPLDFSPSDLGYIDGVIVAGGIDFQDQRWISHCPAECAAVGTCGSNYGPGIDLWAPAHSILAATSNGTMEAAPSSLSGTSFAAPHVTGAVALYLQQNPDAAPAEVEQALVFNAVEPNPPLGDIGDSPNLLLNTGFIPDLTGASLPPLPRDDSEETLQGQTVEIDVLYNDLDRDGRSLEVTLVSDPPNGTAVRLVGGLVEYTPNEGFIGSDVFNYTVRDEDQLTAMGMVTVNVIAAMPPMAFDDHLVGPEDSTCVTCDPAGICFSQLSLTRNDQSEGQLSLVGFEPDEFLPIDCGIGIWWQFTPSGQIPDTRQFTYTVEDAFGARATATLFLTNSSTSEHPSIPDDRFKIDMNTSVSFDVLGSGSGLALDEVTPPEHGTATIVPGNLILYTPNPGFAGFDDFTYLASDANGNQGAATVIVEVGGNAPPVARQDCFSTGVDEIFEFEAICEGDEGEICRDLLANDFDPDGDPLTFVTFSQPGSGEGTLTSATMPDGVHLTYTPPTGWQGEAHFTYTISDGFDETVGTAVIGVGDLFPPLLEAVDDHFTVLQNSILQIPFATLLENDIGQDLWVSEDPYGASHGQVICGGVTGCTYEPDSGYVGEDTLMYGIRDAYGRTDSAEIHIDVVGSFIEAVDDHFTMPQDSILQIPFATLLANDIGTDLWINEDPYGGIHGHVSCVAVTGCTYEPDSGYVGEDTLMYGIRDAFGQTDRAEIHIDVVGTSVEFGTVTTDEVVRTVALSGFDHPVVVMGPPSFAGIHPATLRVRNVTSTSFQHYLQEWDYLDGFHVLETAGYLVVEAGESELGGLRVEARVVGVDDSWQTVAFSTPFPSAPIVLTQVATDLDSAAVTTRVRNVTATGFQVRLQEEEGADGSHMVEEVHFIAVEPGTVPFEGRRLTVTKTGNAVTHDFFTIDFLGFASSNAPPVFIAGAQTFRGANPAVLRQRNLTSASVEVKVEEEQAQDNEVNHVAENVGYMVFR